MSSAAKQNYTLFDHLLELRTRLLHAVLGVLVVFCALIYFAQDIYQYVAQPLLAVMPEGTQMIATDVASPFFTPFKLTIVLSIFITKIKMNRIYLVLLTTAILLVSTTEAAQRVIKNEIANCKGKSYWFTTYPSYNYIRQNVDYEISNSVFTNCPLDFRKNPLVTIKDSRF